MFQLAAKWLLADAPRAFGSAIGKIRLRGYALDEPEIPVPADFFGLRRFPSVNDIALQVCPTRRDLFLRRIRRKEGATKWGRIAGPLVEKYCKGLLDSFLPRALPYGSYQKISKQVEKYSRKYEEDNEPTLDKLANHVTSPKESTELFRAHLRYTAKFEVLMQDADRRLGKRIGNRRKYEFTGNFPLEYKDVKFNPKSETIGISSPATPDFFVPDLSVVGDIKTGTQFEDYHRLTCAGYALAYENQHGKNHEINFGMIYFLGTHTANFFTAQTYLFLIDDDLRQEFIDKRNEALKILKEGESTPPAIVDRDKYCIHCKYLEVCDEERQRH